ncbi:39S ribosomal protein L16, mitochondrial [Thalassophryne amazonica]|uniref:39S ribosomal protein L16, mitochondrial n=1 Tax=Thalassophryne amazonica TaxID=390379 RepID=UPI0014715FC2|nr:39S ribosomal protein L16, mitochondrial [Thalassophryne amazonica]
MASFLKTAVGGLGLMCRVHGHQQGLCHNHFKVLIAGIKTLEVPPDFSDVVLPEKPKLKFVERSPNLVKPKREMKNLRDIQGVDTEANFFTTGKFAIIAMEGGYLHWGHFEMMRLTINRKIDTRTTFAQWRVNAPYKPITRKSLGQRMGGGKGEIDHYVTPVRYGRFIVELGGKVELEEIEYVLKQVAKKLPFRAKVVSRESLAAMHQEQAEMEQNNQNPWTFKEIARGNMLGIRKVISPFDLFHHGRFTGKFHNPGRV